MSHIETTITLTPPSFTVDMTSGRTLVHSLYDGIGRYIFPIRSFGLEVPRIGLPRAVYTKAQSTAVDPTNSPMTVLECLTQNLHLRPDQIYALPGTVTRPIAATDLAVGDVIIEGQARMTVKRVEINTDSASASYHMVDFWVTDDRHCRVHPRGTLLVERDA